MCCDKLALFGKRPSPYYGDNLENFKILQVQSQKPSSDIMKLAFMRTATGKEHPKLPLLQRISSIELTAPQIAAQINALNSSSNRHISTDETA